MKRAREELEKISQNEHEKYMAELRQKYIMDQKAIQDFGYDKGRKEGKEEGIKEGIAEVAKKLKDKNVDIETITEVTGLSKEEIEKL